MRYSSVSLILGLICGVQYPASAEKEYLPFSKNPIPDKTPEPININTGAAVEIKTKPLILITGTSEKVTLINTGKSVEVVLKSSFTSTIAFGGVVYGNFYIYSRQKYYFADVNNGTIYGTTVNGGRSLPLAACIYYYNIKYHTFENALNYRDGILEIRFRIIVKKSVSNRQFNQFAFYLKKITKSGSSVEMPIGPTYEFYKPLSTDAPYYAFPGFFVNNTSGKTYYSTTTIVIPVRHSRFISQRQYDETFSLMLNPHGERLITASTQTPVGNRPIVSAKGIRNISVRGRLFPASPGGF